MGLPDVGDSSRTHSLHTGGRAAGKESENDEHWRIDGDGTENGEDDEEGEGDEINAAAAELLGEGTPPHGKDAHAQHVECDRHVDNRLGSIKLTGQNSKSGYGLN